MKNEKNTLRNLLAGLVLSFIALTGMSFTTDDTTKLTDTVSKINATAQDNCCGISNKVVANIPAIEKLITKNFTSLSLSEISLLDKRMDAFFKQTERRNTEMAVAFGNALVNEIREADNQLSEGLIQSVIAPAFSTNLNSEMQSADIKIDDLIFEEAELTGKARAYKAGLSVQIRIADAIMDQMVNISSLKNFKPALIQEADMLMDLQMQKEGLFASAKLEATSADFQMDELRNKN